MEMETGNMRRAIAPIPLSSASAVPPNSTRNARPSVAVSALWEPAPVANWTVKDAGGTSAPTSNDYDSWNIHQLRRECTARGKKIKRTIEDEGGVRRRWLREDDLQRHTRAENAAPPVPIPTAVSSAVGKAPTPAQQRNAPVVHVITLDKPVAAAPIDRPTLKDSMAQTTGVKRKQQKNDGNVQDDAARSLLRMPQVVPRELVAPRYMSSPLSGALSRLSASTPPVQVSASAKPRSISEILDCLSKTYAIRAQLQASMGGADPHGRRDPFLQQSIELVEAGLRVVEQEYAVAMGIVYPHNKK
jgi:hypothetical protein